MKFNLILIAAALLPASAQIITTSAGNTTWSSVVDVAVDTAGNQYVADRGKHVIYKVDRLGATTIIAGRSGSRGYAGDGQLATDAQLRDPNGVAVASDGSVYIADSGSARIRKISPNGIINTIAGTGTAGFTGDDGPATAARIGAPGGIALDRAGNLYFADTGNNRIRRISATGVITTIFGTGRSAFAGDLGPPLLASGDPRHLAFNADESSLYFSDTDNARVRVIKSNVVTTVAGTGTPRTSGDGGPASAAGFRSTYGVAVDATGNLYIADYWDAIVRKVTPSGIVTTYAGNGRSGTSGDGGPAASAMIYAPIGITTDSTGNLYIADGASYIRKVAPAAGPAVTSVNPSFLGKSGISSNMYLEIYGTNLASRQRQWGTADFNGINAPTSLDGTRVTVNGVPAFIFYISPTQININVPEDGTTGSMSIQVITPAGSSAPVSINRGRASPALHTAPQFLIGGKQYVVAFTADQSSFIGRPGMIPSLSFSPARPGQTVVVYALGCGPTNPITQAGVINSVSAPLSLPHEIRVGGRAANVRFAGLIPASIGLYQLNFDIPDLTPGDHAIELVVGGVANAQDLVIAVGP